MLNLGRARPDRLVERQLHAHYPVGPLIIEPMWIFSSSVEFYLVRICCLSFMVQKPKLQWTWQLHLIWKPHHLLFYPLPLILQGQKITAVNDPPWIPALRVKVISKEPRLPDNLETRVKSQTAPSGGLLCFSSYTARDVTPPAYREKIKMTGFVGLHPFWHQNRLLQQIFVLKHFYFFKATLPTGYISFLSLLGSPALPRVAQIPRSLPSTWLWGLALLPQGPSPQWPMDAPQFSRPTSSSEAGGSLGKLEIPVL